MASATGPVSGAGNLGKPIRIAYIWQVWDVRLHPEVEAWFLDLCRVDPASADLVGEAIDLLAEHGPALGRPLVDRLKGSSFHHMKELRPGSSGTTEIRMIFAFDPLREAVFLVAGDKSGQWQSWYRKAVPLADTRFEEHLIALKEAQR
ncbi:type II toxin-antitoxin system RelE/ParE family toxin [Micromonospora wenchangensis]|uniref:type II toxin-antitoxin system RelE/ParE family toxin n=1 Tax=Micromonospora wenchangensis TaxID=1185415 RepID=UPI0037F2391B